MGSYMSCIFSSPPPTSTYDMTGIQNKNLPMIWITGPPNSGKRTIGRLIRNKYEFEYINITELLRDEVNKESNRALVIKKYLNGNKKVPDYIVMDLLKESLISSTTNKGFVISNFPKTLKQAEAFTRDVGNVNFVFYLYAGFPLLIDRAQRKSTVPLDHDVLRRNISMATREIKSCLGKFVVKIESINTSGLPEETFPKVETALIRRINIARPIIAETDYVQAEKNQQNDQCQNILSVDNTNTEDRQNENKECIQSDEIRDTDNEEEIFENKKQGLKENLVELHDSSNDIPSKDADNEEKEIKLTELNLESILD